MFQITSNFTDSFTISEVMTLLWKRNEHYNYCDSKGKEYVDLVQYHMILCGLNVKTIEIENHWKGSKLLID